MKLAELKKLARSASPVARIISDGCRDYVVEIHQPSGAGILQDRRRRTMRFRSLAEAKQTLKRAQVSNITLAVRVAADEACAIDPQLGMTQRADAAAGFSELRLCNAAR
jgi:hypothetical protein